MVLGRVAQYVCDGDRPFSVCQFDGEVVGQYALLLRNVIACADLLGCGALLVGYLVDVLLTLGRRRGQGELLGGVYQLGIGPLLVRG